MPANLNRRRFLAASAVTGAATIVPRHVLGGAGNVPPSEKITVAHIGMGTQGFREIGYLLGEPRVQIVAVCDPNKDSSDYVEWGKGGILRTLRGYMDEPNWRAGDDGCPGGRDVGKLVVDTYYAKKRAADKFKACTAYADFREMLEKEKDLDAVKIMTPDHLHATISVAAMNKGLHVMMHKPVGNRMAEGRLVVETARKTKVATHLLAYGSGGGNRLIAKAIQKGIIGKLREIHNWTNRPVWPQYTQIPTDTPPVPKGLDWDLWLGPALDRPYHPHYTHTVFRGWYDFGGGSMADMGIYSLWPVFETLGLGVPLLGPGLGHPRLHDRERREPHHQERFFLPHGLQYPPGLCRHRHHARTGSLLVRRRHEASPAQGGGGPHGGNGSRGNSLRRRRRDHHGQFPWRQAAAIREGQTGRPDAQRRFPWRRTPQWLGRRDRGRRAIPGQLPQCGRHHRRGEPRHRCPPGRQASGVRQPGHEDHQRPWGQ